MNRLLDQSLQKSDMEIRSMLVELSGMKSKMRSKKERRQPAWSASGSVVIIFMNIREAKEQIEHAVKLYLEKDEKGRYIIPIEKQRPVF